MNKLVPTGVNRSYAFVRCHCAPLTQCPKNSPICVSTTGCFHSLELDKSLSHVVRERFDCFPNNTNQVDLHCRKPPLANPLVYCCTFSDGDFCNANLAPDLPRSMIAAFFSSENHLIITYLILLPLLALICGLLAIGFLWKFVFRARLRQLALSNESTSYPKSNVGWINSLKKCSVRPLRPPNHAVDLRLIPIDSPRCVNKLLPRAVDDTSRELVSCTSGSGSGLPFLVQRTIARHIRLQACIGKGRFGEVWRAVCQGETVAVKIFPSRDEASWARETEVYNTGLLHHPNLLAYYASDMISRSGCTQLWLITAYHSNGSLYDYINQTVLSLGDSLRLVRSIAAGLTFLHTEIRGLQAKPAIAHRDIKSKNVLVRDDGEACIADLGLAIIQSKALTSGSTIAGNSQFSDATISGTTHSDYLYAGFSGPSSLGPLQPAGPRVGTKRYMAPELLLAVDSARLSTNFGLNESMDLTDENLPGISTVPYLPFEVYQAADVYALSLVTWEIMRCTRGSIPEDNVVEGYQIPYHTMVPTDPSFAQMRSVVCANLSVLDTRSMKPVFNPDSSDRSAACDSESRPPISPRWLSDPFLSRLTQLVQECWHWEWSSRLSALRVRKNLEALEGSFKVYSHRSFVHQ
ncbi:hypothetical protein EG68_11974 [Paragonimus skrjabini miyazakii]|uniref:receptor protein serine/threonine kinase n=1 Tax=Paragonimus skrjabini miyazakii TaxID=59628 RepID=A0A8S9YK70_9TREM|nr:hypothetical protein EG68_11974 [Paragonimus skrjabini miyazakii]